MFEHKQESNFGAIQPHWLKQHLLKNVAETLVIGGYVRNMISCAGSFKTTSNNKSDDAVKRGIINVTVSTLQYWKQMLWNMW